MGQQRLFTVLSLGLVIGSIATPPAQANPAAAAISACAAQPEVCVIVAGAAGATWVLWRGQNALYCTAYQCQWTRQHPATRPQPMMRDPEEGYHSQIIDYVWGDTEAQAIARCKAIAQQHGLRYRTVKRTSQRGKRWECHVDNL